VLLRVRTRLSDAAAYLDGLAPRLALAARTWLLGPVVYAITTGSAIWALSHPGARAAIATNKVILADTLRALGVVVAWLVGFSLLYFLAMRRVFRRTGQWRIAETASALHRRLFPLLALPFLSALLLPSVERDNPRITFLFIAISAAIVARGAYAWTHPAFVDAPLRAPGDAAIPEAPPERPSSERKAKALAAFAVFAIWMGYGFFFSYLSITNHHALNTRTIDLGYYDNIFYQSIHGRPLACTLIKSGYHGSAHFDPLLVLLSPLYLIYPRAEMILVLQSFWIGAGVVPVYLIAKDKLGHRLPAVALAAMYALYPALQGANMYEFHSLSLLSSILLFLLYFLEKGSFKGYFAVLPIALLCREDASLLLCFIGIYAIISGRPGFSRVGWITIVVSVIYFAIVKKVFMTSSDIFMSGKESLSFAYYYDELIPNKNGVAGLVLSLVTNPVFVVKVIFTEPKLLYLLTLFLPLIFLPFFARTRRVMLSYGLLFCLLATRSAVFSPAFQYSNTILPIAFALTPAALAQIADSGLVSAFGLDARRLSRALLVSAFAASLLVSWKFGGIVDNQAFKGGFSRVARRLSQRDRETYAWIRQQVAQIPPNASIAVSNKLGAHASNRKTVYFYLAEPAPTDYVFIDEGEYKGAELDRHNKSVQQGQLVELGRRDKMALFQRAK
jgi:uncharacterized membrane protein